jgi:Family of unknown function (DUF6361)
MPSTLGWIDYDDTQRTSMLRVLAFFRERESRDELGLGTLRDSIAESLFPGTSTLLTRLRYFLFVPWIYQRLEDKGTTGQADVTAKARAAEMALMEALLEAGEDGVIGERSRSDLKSLPSRTYWPSLRSWGIFRLEANQGDYHRAFEHLRAARKQARRREDLDVPDELTLTWHPELPATPAGFPKGATFALERLEAEYLRDQLCERHGSSLFAWLALQDRDVGDLPAIWDHTGLAGFRHEHRTLVHYARILSEVMHGAARLYNLELARARGDAELEATHVEGLDQWARAMAASRARVQGLDLERLWAITHSPAFRIRESTRAFVSAWFEVARSGSLDVADGESARRLVRQRERSLKGAQSRFDNRVALGQWSGAAGLRPMNFRWPIARSFLTDLREGLAREAP